MGTEENIRNTKTIDCKTCGQAYTPACDYHQGRCPHHPSMLDIILSNPHKLRFYNLIKFFKRKIKWH
jgi:hypothetical protein